MSEPEPMEVAVHRDNEGNIAPMPTFYWGRKWDAPFTDDAIPADPNLMALLLPRDDDLCGEPMTLDDDLVMTPFVVGHLECILRQSLGDVPHLEGRCLCAGGSDHDERPYRQGARDAVDWLVRNHRGRFHP